MLACLRYALAEALCGLGDRLTGQAEIAEKSFSCRAVSVPQAFNWESHNQNWFQEVTEQANHFASLGITCVWLPPFTESVSPQGYMPLDLYNLNSCYGSEEDLRR